jgi:hypothetical protein
MSLRKVYACDHENHAHRALMYEVHGEARWWIVKQALGLHTIANEFYVDRMGGTWYVHTFHEQGDEDEQA